MRGPQAVSPYAEDPLIRQAVTEHVNLAVAAGALYAAFISAVGALALVGALAVTRASIWYLPTAFAALFVLYALFLWRAARHRRIRGATAYLFMAVFVSLPTLYLLSAGLFFVGGTAGYITGTFSYVYLLAIGLTGFLLSFRISLFCGIIAAVEYLACFQLAQPTLLAVDAPTPLLFQILTSPFVAAMKAMTLVGMGLVTGGVTVFARRLLLRTLDEEREKEAVERLFGQYVSSIVSKRILKQAAEAGGERVEVVILFSDLRNFAAFSEDRDPAVVVERLNAYFERMVEPIQSEGGVVDKFIGDAVMAVFGGLADLDDPCACAVRAALKMRQALDQLNAQWTMAGLEKFENGIGIHVGQVIQGPIGSHDRKEFTAIGDAVNTAARLERLTKENALPMLISEAVYQRLEDSQRRAFRSLGKAQVKGMQRRLAVYGLAAEAGGLGPALSLEACPAQAARRGEAAPAI